MKFGLGIRFKEAVAVSLVALTLVAVTTAVHLAQLTRVIVEEAGRQVQLVARQIYAQSSRSILRVAAGPKNAATRRRLRGFSTTAWLLDANCVRDDSDRDARSSSHGATREGRWRRNVPPPDASWRENAISAFSPSINAGQTTSVLRGI